MSTKDKKLKALYTKHAQAKQKEARWRWWCHLILVRLFILLGIPGFAIFTHYRLLNPDYPEQRWSQFVAVSVLIVAQAYGLYIGSLAAIWMAGPRTQIQNQICRRELELGLIEPDDDDIEGNHEYIRDMLEDLMERLDHFEQKVSRRYAN